jgi:hypothetical protein
VTMPARTVRQIALTCSISWSPRSARLRLDTDYTYNARSDAPSQDRMVLVPGPRSEQSVWAGT